MNVRELMQLNAWLIGYRERMMGVLQHMNSSNFGQALSLLHDTILGYDEMMRFISNERERKLKRHFIKFKDDRKRGRR